MEATTVANGGDVCISLEMPDAGSVSYNNEEVTASSSHNNQEFNFELLDSLYFDEANSILDSLYFDAANSIQMSDAGSVSFNIEEVTASSIHGNQEFNFELLDSLYFDAANGNINKFQEHSECLDQILTPNGNTILHVYITARSRRVNGQERKTSDFMRRILKMCPDLLWKANKKGETLLHMAARHGHADVANLLLDECKKSYQNHDREHGTSKPIRQMLEMVNEAKDTALHEAVRYNHLDVVRILTKEDPTLPYDANTAGETPLYLAAERGYEEVLKEILRTCLSPADHGPYSRTALHTAVIHKYEGMLSLLLDDKRILKSNQDQNGWTPLHFASHLGDVEILKKLLIKDKSAAYKVDNKGKTALHIAAGLGKVNIMRELIYNCPGCCELVDKRGWNVLHFASASKNRKAIELVVQNPVFGNLINEKDENGSTPFLQANSMQIIIDHPKVDTLVFDNDNRNIVDINMRKHTHWKWPEYVRWRRIHEKVGKGGRIMLKDEDEEEKENNSNPESAKSNNGNGKSEDKSKDDLFRNARQNELMTAALIATVTFTAGLMVPGGFFSEKGPNQGTAILIRNKAFKAFVILNSISIFLSSFAVFTHLSSWPYDVYKTSHRQMRLGRFLIGNAMRAMIGAFLAGTSAVLYKDPTLAISACLVPMAIFALHGLWNSREFMLKKSFKLFQTNNKRANYTEVSEQKIFFMPINAVSPATCPL